jgi:hypothetical protein
MRTHTSVGRPNGNGLSERGEMARASSSAAAFTASVSAALLVACGPTVSSTLFVPAPAMPRDHPITVFMTKAPECPYEELGIVTVSEGAFAGGADTYVLAMKDRARKMGGDALLGYKQGSRTSGAVAVAPGVVGVANEEVHSATVIRFRDASCQK